MKTDAPTSIADQVEAQIDHSEWRTFKFSDLAENINEKISPQSSDLTHYIGLEHLDSGSLKIRRFGDPKAIKGDKLKIYKGDLIFAKRNAYLKRVSVAEFDAIASAHSLVLRAKVETVLPEFLPFFMLSETFWERAIAISVGSLSPTINWKALAKQEFSIPPKIQQAKLVKFLSAADVLLDAKLQQIKAIETTIASSLKDEFHNHSGPFRKLGNAGNWKSGGTPSRKNQDFWGGDIPWVSPKDMKVERIGDSQEKITAAAVESRIATLPLDAILIVVRGLILAHSFPVAITTKEVAFNQDMKALIASDEFEPFYLLYFLQHMKDIVLGMTTTTTHGTKRLASDAIFGLNVPCPAIDDQRAFIQKIETIKLGLNHATESRALTYQLLKSLINQIF